MHNERKISHFFVNQWSWISYLVIFIITFVFFTWLQAPASFPDPDSFYHTEMSLLIPSEGIQKTFPWLQATILKDSFIDQHFLYHVFLMPFTHAMNPIQGAKLATVFLGAGLLTLFYWLMRAQKIKFAFVFTMALLASMPFVFRINLVKAPVVSIILLLVGLYLMFRHRYFLLFGLSFAFVWAYGGFILIIVFTGVYAVVSVFADLWRHERARNFFIVLSHNREVRLFIASCLGVVAGLIINPYFPNNISFYWHQLVQIGIINYRSVISVGNEWYPYSFFDLTANTALVSILVLASILSTVLQYRPPTKKVVTLFFIYILFFAFTLKSRRYVEYYVPFGILFSAFALGQHMYHLEWRRVWSRALSLYMQHRIVGTILIVYFLTTIPTVIIKDIHSTHHDYTSGIPVTRFAGVGSWLAEYSEPGDIVFHSSWDEFPVLFYHSPKDYYIAGLDPTFTYEYSKELYRQMVDITLGSQSTYLYRDITENFHAKYVLVEANHFKMNSNIKANAGFTEVYKDKDATLYQVN
ncbi:MAG: hypothetical protein WC544_00535 [Patescibacteria group bacterium]